MERWRRKNGGRRGKRVDRGVKGGRFKKGRSQKVCMTAEHTLPFMQYWIG